MIINPEITLLSKTYTIDTIGNQVEVVTQLDVPIIRIENIYASEFYNGAQANFKPELRLVISSYNYNDENEFIFNAKNYSVIRIEHPNLDEVTIIAERKVVNVG